MNHNSLPEGWVDSSRFIRNINGVPWEQVAPYVGKHVGWDLEGTRILAGADSVEELLSHLASLGIRSGEFVHDFIDDPNESQS